MGLAYFVLDRYHQGMGRILALKDIGKLVREKRKEKKLSQLDLAENCGVGRRFISELESGKKTRMDLGLTLRVLMRLNLEVIIRDKSGTDL